MVHPQAAGERFFVAPTAIPSSGSSPDGWGEGRPGRDHRRRPRFIPRRLGRGSAGAPSVRAGAVHPQAAGERNYFDGSPHPGGGSSPGGWGEGAGRVVRGRGPRFIPRRLGRGSCGTTRRAGGTVHPQAAGERAIWPPTRAAPCGSSPGGWGEAVARGEDRRRRGFIPRRLGRGPARPTAPTSSSVHPQAAGERAPTERYCWAYHGSSPGGWGEAPVVRLRRESRRFIPRRLGRGRRRRRRSRP